MIIKIIKINYKLYKNVKTNGILNLYCVMPELMMNIVDKA
jgi:hypothetical protein